MPILKELSPDEITRLTQIMTPPDLDVAQYKHFFPDLKYGNDPRQSLDLYLPDEGNGPFPVIFYIHGGAWSMGDKRDGQEKPFLAGLERGYAVVSTGYRLVPQVRYPDNLFDIKASLRWVGANAEKYNLDAKSIAIAGSSAGAHLAMMVGFTQNEAVFEGAPLENTYDIKAVVEHFGPTNFEKTDYYYETSGIPRFPRSHFGTPNILDTMLGFTCEETMNMLRFVSPYHCVHPNIPPILMQQGQYDPIVNYQHATDLMEKIYDTAGKDRVVLHLFDDYTHADPRFSNEENIVRIFKFLDPIIKG